MPRNNEIRKCPNNSRAQSTSTHETSAKYKDSKQQSAYEVGLKEGRIEGMIAYQKHLIQNLQRENQQLTERLLSEKGGNK